MNKRKAEQMAERKALDKMHQIYQENLRQKRILQMLMDARDTSLDDRDLNGNGSKRAKSNHHPESKREVKK